MIHLQNLVFQSGLDLNVERQTYGLLRSCAKGRYAPRQARVFSAHGLSANEHLSALCCQASWRAQGQGLLVPGSILCYDVCATDLPGILARYRSQPASTSQSAVPHGLSLRYDFSQHAGQCERHPTLANLCRLRATSDCHGQAAVCQGAFGHRSGCCRLRVRRQHHRLVSFAASLGAVSFHEGRHQAAHAAGLAWLQAQESQTASSLCTISGNCATMRISSAAWALGLAPPYSQFSSERGLVRTEVASACPPAAISARQSLRSIRKK